MRDREAELDDFAAQFQDDEEDEHEEPASSEPIFRRERQPEEAEPETTKKPKRRKFSIKITLASIAVLASLVVGCWALGGGPEQTVEAPEAKETFDDFLDQQAKRYASRGHIGDANPAFGDHVLKEKPKPGLFQRFILNIKEILSIPSN